ncbi:MAG: hypothetical protein PHE93_02800, partial [Clostridia bacterium]|nr:hypothetical protein [Clostridia bacterium]
MRKKLSLVLIAVLLLILVGSFVACNQPTPQTIIIDSDNTQNATNSVSKDYAWDRIYNGMKAVGTEDSTFINFDTVFYFSFQRDGVGAVYYLRAKGSIDIYDDTKSKLAIELGKDFDGAEDLLFGLYYTYSENLQSGLLYADMTALAGGTKILKVTDLSLSQFTGVISNVLDKLNLENTIDGLLNTQLLGNTITSWISNVLFGECQIFDNGNGKETINVKLDITDILDIALGAVGGLLADYQDIVTVVKDVIGIDLNNLQALIPAVTGSFNVVLQNDVFQSMGVELDVYYPDLENPSEIVSVNLGVEKLELGTVPVVDFPEIPEADLTPFSFTTLSLDMQAYLTTSDTSITISGVQDAFGTLLTSLLASVSNTALATTPITFEASTYEVELKLRAELDLTDNDQTNILCELYGKDSMRVGIYYIGLDDTLYIDLSGVLGTGARYKIEDLDVVDLIWTALNKLVDGIGADEASSTANLTTAQKVGLFFEQYVTTDMDNIGGYVESLITSGEVTQQLTLSGSGEASSAAIDYASLITSILSSLKITKGDGLLSIDRITMVLTKEVLSSIVGMIQEGAQVPIEVVNIEYNSDGFLEGKTLTVDVIFDGILDGFSATINAGITYGSLTDEESMRSTLAGIQQTKSSFLPLSEDGGLDIENIYASMDGELNFYTLNGDMTTIAYEDIDSPSTMLLQILLKMSNTNNVNLRFNLAANINIKSIWDSQLKFVVTDTEGEVYLEIYFSEKTLYLDASYFGLQKVKIDISSFLPTESESSSTADEVSEEAGGIDIMSVLAAMIGNVNIGTDYLEVLLADRILTQVMSLIDSTFIDKLTIGGEEDFDGGIRVSFGDGLNLNEVSLYIFASSGSNFDMGLSLSNLSIGLAGENIAPPQYILIEDLTEFEASGGTPYSYNSTTGLYEAGYGNYQENIYADFINEPNVWFKVAGQMSFEIQPGQLDLSSGLGELLSTIGMTADSGISNITMEELIDETFNLTLEANLDLEPLIKKLQKKEYTTIGNQTQFLLELTREVEGAEDETIFGIYYRGGILYLDIAVLGIEKVAIEFDMMDLVMGLFATEDVVDENQEATGTDFEFSTTYENAQGEIQNYDVALLIALAMSDENIVLSIADGLTELVLNKIGFGFPEVIAQLDLRWKDSEEQDILGNPIYEAGLSIYGAILDDQGDEKISLTIAVAQPEIDFEIHNISKTVFGPEYTLIQLYDEAGNIGIPGVYLETTGYVTMTAYGSDVGENDWQVGDWLESILSIEDAGLDTLLKQLIFSFDIHSQIENTLGFKVALMLRLDNENANINDPDFSIGSLLNFDYILTHSDLAIEIWNGLVGSEVSEKVISLYLVYEGENALGVPYSTLYLDVDTTLINDVHIKLEGFSLASLLGMLEENYAETFEMTDLDTSTTWSPFDAVTEEDVTFVSSNTAVATIGEYSAEGVLTINLLGVEGEAVITATRGDQVVMAQVIVAAMTPAEEEPEEPVDTETNSTLSTIATIISGGISSITINEDQLMINLGAKLIGVVLGLFLPDIYVTDPETGEVTMADMVELNPERSFISLNWTTKEMVASIGIDPVAVAIGIDGVNIALYEKEVAGVKVDDYINLTELSQFSLSFEINLEFELKEGTGDEAIQIDDYLKAFIADIALDFGLEITDDIYAGLSLEMEANLNLNNIAGTEVFLQLVNNNTGEVLIGMYLVGDILYINMGMLSEQNVKLENISVAQIVGDALNGIVSKVSTSVTEAAGTEDVATVDQERALGVIFSFAKNEISLTITQNLIIAVVNYIVNNKKAEEDKIDLNSIFYGDNAIADLGMSLNAIINTQLPSLTINFDSNLLSLSASIVEPFFTTKLNPDRYVANEDYITGADWNGLYLMNNGEYIEITTLNRYSKGLDDIYSQDEEGSYVLVSQDPYTYVSLGSGTVKYSKRITTSARIQEAIAEIEFNSLDEQPNLFFNVDFYFNYSLDATYTLLSEEEADKLPADQRYAKRVSDGYFVQNDTGLYQKVPTELQSLLDAVLGLDMLQDLQNTVVKKGTTTEFDVTLGDLLARLALEIYIDDPINQQIKLSLFGNVDLEKLGIMSLLSGEGKLADLDFSLASLLEAIELGLTFTVGEGTADEKQIKISFVDQLLYIDLTDIEGPRIKLDILSFFAPNDVAEEATSTEGEVEESTMSTLSKVLNAIIKVAIIKGRTVVGGINSEFDSFNIYFNSDLLSSVINLFSENSTFDMSRYALDESASGLFLLFNDTEFGGPSLNLVLRSLEGLEIKLTMATGISVDIGTASSILSEDEKKQYADLTNFSTQTYNFSVIGNLHFGAEDAANYDLSGLFASWFGDMLFELKSESEFEDAISFRLSANVNLADIYLEYLTEKDEYALIGAEETWSGDRYLYDTTTKSYIIDNVNGIYKLVNEKPTFDEFVENSNLDTLEIALELLELNSKNELVLDVNGDPVVTGGIYLFGGALYMDGSRIFENAPISYIPNIFDILRSLNETASDVLSGDDGGEALSTADGSVEIDQGNDAVLALMFSDPSIQLCLTKSFISILLGLLLPDLGSIDDIFDTLSISLSFDKGVVEYKEIDLSELCSDTRYTHYYEDVAGTFGYINGEFVAVDETYAETKYSYDENTFFESEIGEYKTSTSENYIALDFDEEYEGTQYNYEYYQTDAGAYLKVLSAYYNLSEYSAYRFDDNEGITANPVGAYVYIGETYIEILPADCYDLGFVAVAEGEDGEYKQGEYGDYIKIHKGVDGKESLWTANRYAEGYYLNENGSYVKIGENSYYEIPAARYVWDGDTTYTLNETGNYIYIVATQTFVELTAENCYSFGFYLDNESGMFKKGEATFVMILPYEERYKEVVTYSLSTDGEYKHVGEVYELIGEEETYTGDRFTQYTNYVLNPTDTYNAEYSYMRMSRRFRSIDEFGLSLNVNVGVFNLGLAINGLNIGFGQTSQLIPQEVVDNARPFYESTINVSTTIDLKLSMTAGTIDMGDLFYALVGDIDGLVIEIPEYGLGQSAMHMRAKIDLKLDLRSLANSELSLEFYMVTGVGYEDLWFGLYYQGDVLYIDASKLNMPKISISEGGFAQKLEEMLGKYLGRDIYTEDELEASSTGEDIDYEAAASLLIGSKNFTITIGEDLVYYVLKLIKLGETPLYDLVYGGLDASGSVDLNIDLLDINSTDFEFNLGIKLAAGDDYLPMTPGELAQTDTLASDYVNPTLRYKFAADTSGLFKYDETTSAYVKLHSTQLIDASLRFSPVLYGADLDDMVLANYNYKLIPGESANFDNYEKELLLNLHVYQLNIAFDLEHEFKLSPEDVATFTEYKEIEHITLSERVELSTLFEESSLDLSEWVLLFFPDEDISTLQGLINVDANGDGDFDDEGEVLSRNTYLDISIDIKFAAIVNLLRRLALTDAVTGEQVMQWIDGDMDITSLIELFKNSEFDIVELVSYINASLIITTETPEDGVKTIMALYIQGGYYKQVANFVVAEEGYTGQLYSYDASESTEYIEDDNGIYKSVIDTAKLSTMAAADRYSHYFLNEFGTYVYTNGQYVIADENSVGARYSYDHVNFYQNALGQYERISGGTYIDLTYFGIPYIYLNSGMLEEIFDNFTSASASEEAVSTDEVSTETPTEEASSISFPLLDSDTTDVIKMFIWGLQVSSSYVSIVLQATYLNALAQLVTDEDDNFSFYFDFNNRSTIKINTDRTRYRYEAIVDGEVLADANTTKYIITETVEGSYVVYNGYAVLKGSLSDEQLEDITGLPFNVVATTQEYVDANIAETYYTIIVKTDDDIALLEASIYLFNHKLNLSLSFPKLGSLRFNYVTDGASSVPATSRYARTTLYGEDDGTMSIADADYYLLDNESYYAITSDLRFADELGATQDANGDYLKIGDTQYVSISAGTVKRALKYYYTQDDNGAYIRMPKNLSEMRAPLFEENENGTFKYDESLEKYIEIGGEIYEGTKYSLIDYTDIGDISKMSVTLEGSFTMSGEYSETPLSDVLYGLVGDLSSLLTVGMDGNAYNLEIGFAAAVNLDFNLDYAKIGTGAPMSEIFVINQLDIAIDIWRVEEDLSITNLVGIYYYNGYLYVDLSFILADGGMVCIEVGDGAIENLINSLFAPAEEDAEAASTEVLQGANRAIAGIYVDISRNNLAVKLSTALIKLIIE